MNRSKADLVKDGLLKEVSTFVVTECLSVVEKLKKMEERQRNVSKMMDTKSERLSEVQRLATENSERFKDCELEEMEKFSQVRVELEKEQSSLQAQLVDLETNMLPVINNEILEIKKNRDERVSSFMYRRKEQFHEEIYLIVHNFLEAYLTAWHETIAAVSIQYRISPAQQQVLRDLQFYSPLVLAACDQNGNPFLIKMEQDIRNKPCAEVVEK